MSWPFADGYPLRTHRCGLTCENPEHRAEAWAEVDEIWAGEAHGYAGACRGYRLGQGGQQVPCNCGWEGSNA